MPGPRSRTVSSPSASRISNRPLGRAELGRVVEQVLDRHPEPVGAAVDRALGQVRVELGLRPVPPGRIEGVGRRGVEPDPRSLPLRGSPLARSVTLTTRRLSSSTWSATRASTSVRSAAGISGCSSSMSALMRRLASGVRSSWLASLTSRRCASSDRCSAPSMALNDMASRPSSSGRRTSTRRSGSPVSVTSSATPASRATGASPARATAQPSRVAATTPTTLSTASVVPMLATS